MDAVRQAKAKLQPALMGFGKGTSYLNVNRNVIQTDILEMDTGGKHGWVFRQER